MKILILAFTHHLCLYIVDLTHLSLSLMPLFQLSSIFWVMELEELMNFSRARSMSARPEVTKSLLSDIRPWVSGTGMVFSFIFKSYFVVCMFVFPVVRCQSVVTLRLITAAATQTGPLHWAAC